jgi:hypothetical protein
MIAARFGCELLGTYWYVVERQAPCIEPVAVSSQAA